MPNSERARIIFDASPLRYLYTGLGQFSYQLLREFAKLQTNDFDIFALVHPNYRTNVPPGILVERASFIRRHSPASIQQFLFGPCRLWHMTTENTRLMGVPALSRVVLTIHGLHFLDEENDEIARVRLRKVQQLVNRADAITAVSHFTANLIDEKLDLKGKSVKVIYNGISLQDRSALKPDWAPDGKFIFSVGTFFKRKNFHVLIPMMHHLPGYQLILAGDSSRDYGEVVRKEILRHGLQARVIIPGEISEDQKVWLYQNGDALVLTSLSEGFGIPVIESLYYGKPVFCGRYGSLPEIGKDHAYYWENFEPEYMAKEVRKKLDEEPWVEKSNRKEYAKQFSWNRAAKDFWEVYKSLVG